MVSLLSPIRKNPKLKRWDEYFSLFSSNRSKTTFRERHFLVYEWFASRIPLIPYQKMLNIFTGLFNGSGTTLCLQEIFSDGSNQPLNRTQRLIKYRKWNITKNNSTEAKKQRETMDLCLAFNFLFYLTVYPNVCDTLASKRVWTVENYNSQARSEDN